MSDKAARTRELLTETALRLFRERGYEATTMRLVATEAGVSQGNAYYYFDGKDAFVQELYRRLQEEHADRALPLLRDGAPLGENLRAVMHAGLDAFAPYHSFGSTLLHVALSSSSAVSPFSAESGEARRRATGIMEAVAGRSKGVPRGAPGERLPHLLWMAWLGVTLHWVTDTTEGQRRTRRLVDGAAPLLARAVGLARLPVGRGLADDLAALVDDLEQVRS